MKLSKRFEDIMEFLLDYCGEDRIVRIVTTMDGEICVDTGLGCTFFRDAKIVLKASSILIEGYVLKEDSCSKEVDEDEVAEFILQKMEFKAK
jgi:hypothetical protein